MRRGTQGHVVESTRASVWREGGTEVAWKRGSATRVHVDTRMAPRGSVTACEWWAHGLVCPSESIGAVTQMRYAAPPYIPVLSLCFSLCGTMSPSFVFISSDVAMFKTSDRVI